jgi:hypothetical protein
MKIECRHTGLPMYLVKKPLRHGGQYIHTNYNIGLAKHYQLLFSCFYSSNSRNFCLAGNRMGTLHLSANCLWYIAFRRPNVQKGSRCLSLFLSRCLPGHQQFVENARIAAGEYLLSDRHCTNRPRRYNLSTLWAKGQWCRMVERPRAFVRCNESFWPRPESGGLDIANLSSVGGRAAIICRMRRDAWIYQLPPVKQKPGPGRRRKRGDRGPEHAAAMSLWQYSTVWLWYLQKKRLWNRLSTLPCCRAKVRPSFADALASLRRVLWRERIKSMFDNSIIHNKITDFLIAELSAAA